MNVCRRSLENDRLHLFDISTYTVRYSIFLIQMKIILFCEVNKNDMREFFRIFLGTFYCLIITPPLNFQNSCLKRGGLLLSPEIYFEFSQYFLLGTSTPPLLSPGVSFEIAVLIVLSNFHCIMFHFCCSLLSHLCIKHGTRATN